uniref:(northern house mosquito) hypothetical protein n=1 Tax=Culex pipiens TaxID=7175 RepID=A0A8D8CM37_CULPI
MRVTFVIESVVPIVSGMLEVTESQRGLSRASLSAERCEVQMSSAVPLAGFSGFQPSLQEEGCGEQVETMISVVALGSISASMASNEKCLDASYVVSGVASLLECGELQLVSCCGTWSRYSGLM